MSQTPSNFAAGGLPVGEYVLDEKIGQDAVGELWKAHHRAWTDQFAAVKFPVDPKFLQQLQGKGFNLHRLNHPNIARIIGFDPAASPPYMMTDLVEGPTLAQVLAKTRLSVAHAVAITRQILMALAYAHKQNIVHGDIRPENILLEKSAADFGYTDDGSVKLAGFGLAASAQTAGAAAYAAPEQRDGAAPDALSDLFACGVVYFQMLTGERPQGAESPSEVNPKVPTALDDIFRKAYARRERRFPSAQAFLTALDLAMSGNAPSPAPTSAPVQATPASSPPSPFNSDAVIGFRADEDPAPIETIAPVPLAEAPLEPEPVAAPPPPPEPAPAAESQPAPPPRPAGKQPSRALVVIDELGHKPLRTVEELRAAFKRIYATREMEDAEVANLRLRLDQWAESAGGLPGFGDRVQVTHALDCPYHRVVVRSDFEDGGQNGDGSVEEAVMLANPSASQDCGQTIGPDDFSKVVHLSSGVFPPSMLEMIPVPAVRFAVNNLLTAARARANGKTIVRQELRIDRANVLSLRYSFAGAEHGVCFAGVSLQVVAPIAPLTRMRDETLKRAAGLLDTDNIGAGISELRQLFLTSSRTESRAERMLIALRAKLAASYVALAGATSGNLGLFESFTYSRRASALLPGNPEAQAHENRVSGLSFWVHAGPGILIGMTFAIFALLNNSGNVFGYWAASAASIIAGVVSWHKLRARMSRTDAAFCHACLLPLAIAAILAAVLRSPKNAITDIAAAVLVVVVVIIDRMIFNNYGYWLMRPSQGENLGGTPLDVLNQIQTMLQDDWEHLQPYYAQQPPLYKHAGATIQETSPDEVDLPELG